MPEIRSATALQACQVNGQQQQARMTPNSRALVASYDSQQPRYPGQGNPNLGPSPPDPGPVPHLRARGDCRGSGMGSEEIPPCGLPRRIKRRRTIGPCVPFLSRELDQPTAAFSFLSFLGSFGTASGAFLLKSQECDAVSARDQESLGETTATARSDDDVALAKQLEARFAYWNTREGFCVAGSARAEYI